MKKQISFVAAMAGLIMLIAFGSWFSLADSTGESVSLLASNSTQVKAKPDDRIALPILMYHSILKNPSVQNNFFLSKDTFESDLKYLKEKGYTTIVMQDLIDYVKKGVPLPEKPIILTFDDGCYNNHLNAEPLLKEYGMKGVLSVLGSGTDKFSAPGVDADQEEYSHITWRELRKMAASGIWEIQNHTYDSHSFGKGRRGVIQMPGESPEDYREFLKEDVGYLQDRITEMTGVTPTTFTFPYGLYNEDSTEYLKELGFSASLTCLGGVNYIPQNDIPEDVLFNLKRITRGPHVSTEALLNKYDLEP